MADPIASSALSVVVGDPEHIINFAVAIDPDGSPSLNVGRVLAVRANGRVLDRLRGEFNLTKAVTDGVIAQEDVDALRRVLVALGQNLAVGAGMTVA